MCVGGIPRRSLLNFLRGIQNPIEGLKKGFGNCCVFVYEYEDGMFSLKKVIREIEETAI